MGRGMESLWCSADSWKDFRFGNDSRHRGSVPRPMSSKKSLSPPSNADASNRSDGGRTATSCTTQTTDAKRAPIRVVGLIRTVRNLARAGSQHNHDSCQKSDPLDSNRSPFSNYGWATRIRTPLDSNPSPKGAAREFEDLPALQNRICYHCTKVSRDVSPPDKPLDH